jgi:predicted RNA polymerase sigma factor
MMFSCCHPRLPEEVQIALVLNTLCGFGASEISRAFLTSRAAMEKRISRGKKVLASAKRLFDLSDAEFGSRLSAVQRALYLLFNEGYHSASADRTVREELCDEAIRLTMLLLEASSTTQPDTYALAALMFLHASRLPTRLDAEGELNPLLEQDRSRWDRRLVEEGLALLDRSATGSVVSAYHLEAAIAAAHATAHSVETTNWKAIVHLYDRLMDVAPSPVVALNRAIAIGQADGPSPGLEALRSIPDSDRLHQYPFYAAALGEFELCRGNFNAASEQFAYAAALARNPAERRFLDRRWRESLRP